MQIADRYHQAFQELNELGLPVEVDGREGTTHSWHLYVIRLSLERLHIDRNKFIDELRRRGIGTSVHFIPLHIHPYYRETYGYQPDDFPVAYKTYQRIISLPIYARMTDEDVERVIETVRDVVTSHRK
jgi:dTDP-4-amino-4,6-dideoxygalactose transaminase